MCGSSGTVPLLTSAEYLGYMGTQKERGSEVVLGDKPSIRDDSQYIDKNLLEKLGQCLRSGYWVMVQNLIKVFSASWVLMMFKGF